MAFQTPITIREALRRIHDHRYVLPAIQREFVWDRDQILRLFDSLLRGCPIGSFLFWSIDAERSQDFVYYDFIREYHELKNRHCPRLPWTEPQPLTAILDGQQRLTSLNIGLAGSHAEKLPRKWSSNPDAYPVKYLYLDLLHEPDPEEDLQHDFRFFTVEEAEEEASEDVYWYRVSDVLRLDAGPEMHELSSASRTW